jgi:hypothetical protein
MRRLRLRFTLRRLMLGVAALALLMGLIRGADWDPVRSVGVGNTTVLLVFVVREADSGAPIQEATIRLKDPDFLPCPEPNPPYVFELKTGQDGRAQYNYPAMVYVWRRSSLEWEWRVSYPACEMKIAAEGYVGFAASFRGYADQRGGEGSHKGRLPPPAPPIEVRLRKLTQPETPGRALPQL